MRLAVAILLFVIVALNGCATYFYTERRLLLLRYVAKTARELGGELSDSDLFWSRMRSVFCVIALFSGALILMGFLMRFTNSLPIALFGVAGMLTFVETAWALMLFTFAWNPSPDQNSNVHHRAWFD
jgi:hypothetical protein